MYTLIVYVNNWSGLLVKNCTFFQSMAYTETFDVDLRINYCLPQDGCVIDYTIMHICTAVYFVYLKESHSCIQLKKIGPCKVAFMQLLNDKVWQFNCIFSA